LKFFDKKYCTGGVAKAKTPREIKAVLNARGYNRNHFQFLGVGEMVTRNKRKTQQVQILPPLCNFQLCWRVWLGEIAQKAPSPCKPVVK